MTPASKTLVHHIEHWARAKPHEPALNGRRDGRWFSLTWSEYWQAVREVAKGLRALGHQPDECIAVVGPNEPEWVIFQFGIQAANGIPAPLYPNNTPEQTAHILGNARARMAVCGDAALVRKMLEAEAAGGGQKLEHIFTFTDIKSEDARVMSLDALRSLGREQSDADLDAALEAIDPEKTSFLIYTSGTTGMPKGVRLTHRGQIIVGQSVLEVYPQFGGRVPYRVVSYLPLSHQAEQIITNILVLITGGQVTFCPSMDDIKDFLVHVRPTVFLGVPRVWEKFQAALEARLGEATGVKAALATWARKVELKWAMLEFERGAVRPSLLRSVAQALVIKKVRSGLGLDQLDIACTGAAPISENTLAFFASLGICLHDAYGLTETTGLASVTPARRPLFGAVGKPLACVEARIASDGEIQLKGPAMTAGYLHMPEESRELFSEDGWLCTGDLGSLDSRGYLHITGRKKELLITAGGKNVAPVEIENHLKAIEGVGQVMVVGDSKPYLAALLTLDAENLATLAERAGTRQADLATMAADPKVRAYLQQAIETRCNAKLARYQTVKTFEVLPTEWTPDGGEMTPTMKLRRAPTAAKYAAEIEALYAGKESKRATA